VIHVAGTNGKGSVIAFLKAMIEAAGLRAHVYTSPHLVHFRERIAVCGAPMDDRALTKILEECEAANAGAPITFFEITTAAALLAFSRHRANVVLLETGLGGRFDSTNVIAAPRLCAITPISIDHVQFLGETLAEIAFEKAGILKPGVGCVVAPQLPAAARVIDERASAVGATLFRAGREWRVDGHRYVDDAGGLDMPPPALAGDHQIGNAALAYACVRQFDELGIGDEAARDGIATASWPARLQRLVDGGLVAELPPGWELWLDGGHNLSAANALARFAHSRDDRPLHVVAGLLNNRNAVAFLQVLAPLARSVQTVAIPGEANSHDPEQIARDARAAGIDAQAAPDIGQAIRTLAGRGEAAGRVLICGSLYLAGAVLAGVDSRAGFRHPPPG
jgi:dihydrofolate synthase / folylpolyglutamate synthase